MGKHRRQNPTTRLSPADEFDAKRPCYLLLGWMASDLPEAGGFWSLITEELLTYSECCKVYEKGLEPYEKFMTVSKAEFETLGIPLDREASIYFDLDCQKEVSLRSNSGKREKKHGKD